MNRNFWILSKSYFSNNTHLRAIKGLDEGADEITFGLYDEHGGSTGEFMLRWEPQGDGELLPKLEIPFGAWNQIDLFADVLAALEELQAKNKVPSVGQVAYLLKRCGLRDVTEKTVEDACELLDA